MERGLSELTLISHPSPGICPRISPLGAIGTELQSIGRHTTEFPVISLLKSPGQLLGGEGERGSWFVFRIIDKVRKCLPSSGPVSGVGS